MQLECVTAELICEMQHTYTGEEKKSGKNGTSHNIVIKDTNKPSGFLRRVEW
jgi:hypothetical protein